MTNYILPATWAKVERMYFEGAATLTKIASDCEISLSSLRKRIKTRGWPSLRTLELDGASSERARLRGIIANKLTRLETRMKTPDTETATDSERQSREFGSLMTTVDKLDAKEGVWKRTLITTPASEIASDATQGEDHVDQWRAELAQRISRLGTKWNG